MIKFVISFVFIFNASESLLFSQDTLSRVTYFLDSLNKYSWGKNELYISNLEKLSQIAIQEDSFDIYELCRHSIHLTYLEMEDYVGFESALDNSALFAQDSLNSSPYYKSLIQGGRAILYRYIGDSKMASDLRLEAINFVKSIEGNEPTLIGIYGNIIVDFNIIGDFVKSRKYVNRAFDLLKKDKEVDVYHDALFYLLLGKIDFFEGSYESAFVNLRKAKSIIDHRYYSSYNMERLRMNVYLWYSQSAVEVDQHDLATSIIQEVIHLQDSIDYRIYRTSEVLANLYMKMGDDKKSLKYLNQSIEDAEDAKLLLSEYSVVPRMYYNLAKFYYENGEINKGLKKTQKGLKYFVDTLNNDLSSNPDIRNFKDAIIGMKLINLKSKITKAKYQEDELELSYTIAKNAFDTSLKLHSIMRNKFVLDDSKYYALEKAIPIYDSYLDLVHEHLEKTGDKSDKQLLYNIIGQTKSAILSDNINYKNVISDPNLPPSLVAKEKELRLNRALYKKEVKKMEAQDSVDVEKLASIKDSLFSFNQDYDILDKRIREAKEEVAGWNLNDDISFNEFSEQLRTGEMVIDYYESDEYIYSVAVLDEEIFVDRICLSDIEEEVNSFVNYISTPPRIATSLNVEEVSQKILNTLLKPYSEYKSSVNSLRILPSGILNAMPFEALSYEEKGTIKYLIEDCPILYSVSRSQLLRREQIPSSYNIMALAPKFESEVISDTRYACDGAELSNLKYAQEEVGYIHDTYKISSNDSISANYFLNNISNHDICHLATHGCVNTSDPMLSEIFFNDQPVTGYDVMNLDTDVSLMFLSACNTAKGEDVQGEGVVGLTSGFFEAGVRNMVSSLWSIDDLASSQIVKGFYKNVKEGSTYSESLRSSKLEYLESADKLRSHPYYWAGLVQIGAGVTVSNSLPWWIYLGGGFVVFLSFLLMRNKL